jgi:hypothetical protein
MLGDIKHLIIFLYKIYYLMLHRYYFYVLRAFSYLNADLTYFPPHLHLYPLLVDYYSSKVSSAWSNQCFGTDLVY